METIFEYIVDVHQHMSEYQQKYNITRECVSNTYYFINRVNDKYGINVLNAKAVIACWVDDTKMMVCCNHMVAEIQGTTKLIDPSWEVHQHRPKYFTTLAEFFKYFPDYPHSKHRKLIRRMIDFADKADIINNGGMIDHELYEKQAKYVDRKLNNF